VVLVVFRLFVGRRSRRRRTYRGRRYRR